MFYPLFPWTRECIFKLLDFSLGKSEFNEILLCIHSDERKLNRIKLLTECVAFCGTGFGDPGHVIRFVINFILSLSSNRNEVFGSIIWKSLYLKTFNGQVSPYHSKIRLK